MTLRARGLEERIRQDAEAGKWKPQTGDAIRDCEFIRVGFRAYGLEAPDHKWRLDVTKLDFADRNPTALLEVRAPNHDNAFGDLGWFVFSHTVGINGGTNFNQCIARLSSTLGGNKEDWDRRLTYLIARAKEANAGTGNGTFAITGLPAVPAAHPFVVYARIREGRTVSIFGPGSAGKTTLVDGLIVSFCSGTEVIPGWAPTRRYRCLLLDWDEGYEEEQVRLSAICQAYGVELPAGYHYKRMSRPLSDLADEIGAYIVQNEIEVVVVSPVGRSTRDHGDNMTAPIDELYEVLRTFGTTNILIDHVTGANMNGGAEREFGSVRKRDNARGSWSLYMQSEDMGERVVVLKNTKPDAMSPKHAPQAIRIEYDPPEGRAGVYDTIRFVADEVQAEPGYATPGASIGGPAMRTVIHNLLLRGHMNVADIAQETGYNSPSIRTVLNRNRDWFGKLPSTDRWEALPRP